MWLSYRGLFFRTRDPSCCVNVKSWVLIIPCPRRTRDFLLSYSMVVTTETWDPLQSLGPNTPIYVTVVFLSLPFYSVTEPGTPRSSSCHYWWGTSLCKRVVKLDVPRSGLDPFVPWHRQTGISVLPCRIDPETKRLYVHKIDKPGSFLSMRSVTSET